MEHSPRGNNQHGCLDFPHARTSKRGLLPVAVIPQCNGLTTLQSSSTMESLEVSTSGLEPLSFLAISMSCTSEAIIEGPQVSNLGKAPVKSLKFKAYQVDQIEELNIFCKSCLNIEDTANDYGPSKNEGRQKENTAISSAEWPRGCVLHPGPSFSKGAYSQWQIDHLERVDEWVGCTTQVHLERQSLSGKGTDDEFILITQMNAGHSEAPSGCASLASSTIEFVWDYLVEGGECFRAEEDYLADDELSVSKEPWKASKFCIHTGNAGSVEQSHRYSPRRESDGARNSLSISRLKGFWEKTCKVGDGDQQCLSIDGHRVRTCDDKKTLWSGFKDGKDVKEQPNRQLCFSLEKLLLSCIGKVA